MAKHIELINGQFREVQPVNQSAGVADAAKMVQLGPDGKLHESMMPTGLAADVKAIIASEALAANDLVEVYDNGGVANVRKADNSNSRRAVGFVLSEVLVPGSSVSVYFEGTIIGQAGLTIGGACYLSTTGLITQTPPVSPAAQISQEIGLAISANEVSFEPQRPVTLV